MSNVRGIVNNTTACHVTSSLVILCHCLPPVREALFQSVTATNHSSQNRLVRELAFFLRDYYVPGDADFESWVSQPVEVPARLYRALLSEAGVQAEDVGDAVTTLAKILDHLRRCEDVPEVARTVKAALDGTCYRVIQDGHRRKILPHRAMPCPFPVRIDNEGTSLLESLRRTLQSQVVQAYQWMGEFEILSSGPAQPHVDTTKSLVLEKAPPVWIIHLDRFVDGAHTRQRDVVDTPLSLDASSLGINAEYRLMGAVVYISDGKHEDDDESAGHTVAVIRDEGSGDGSSLREAKWFIVDDDKVTSISTSEAVRMISGCQTEQGSASGVVVVYHQLGWHWKELLHDHAAGMQQSTLATVDWTMPILLIGRRVKVRWARETWYEGTVSSYDPASRKHTIAYDDGEIRSYDLKRKTIEWL